jgi:hypothetical protein
VDIIYNKIAQYRFKNTSVACVKVKKLAKLLRQKLLAMVELKSDMEELYVTEANAM